MPTSRPHQATPVPADRRVRRGQARLQDESGFSLMETVIAITIAAMIFTASALMLGQSLKGTLLARQNEQAAEVITAEIEAIRSLDYAAIAMVAADVAGDPAITGSPLAVDHDGAGPLGAETVSLSTTGAVNPHISTVVRNSTDYTITRYVSEVADSVEPSAKVKRVTVRARWQSGAREHERVSSTLVTRTRRGLPLPEFSFGDAITKDVATGGNIVLPVSLTNRGARDTWNLSVTSNPTLVDGWTWYVDSGASGTADGTYDAAHDVAATNTDGDAGSRVDTGPVDVDDTISLLAVYDGTVPDPAAASYAISLTAQSSAQAAATGGTATVVDTVKVTTSTSPTCTTCVTETYALHNTLPICSASCATDALDPLSLDAGAPLAAALDDFDMDTDTAAATSSTLRAGRRISEGGTGATEAAKSKMVRWSRQMQVRTDVKGPASLRLHVAPIDSGVDGVVVFDAYVVRRSKNGPAGDQVLATAASSATGSASTTWEPKTLVFELPATTFAKNDRIEVRIVVRDDTSGTDSMRVAYDTTATAGDFSYGVIP